MRIAIAGASGRMGRMLIDAVLATKDLTLAVALDRPGSTAIGQDAGAPAGVTTGVIITDDINALGQADCLIDFTRPEGTLAHLDACVRHGTKIVIGTTGFDEAGHAAIHAAAEKIAVVFAPNMSVGVNATLRLLELAAKLLNEGYDTEIFEAHHKHKIDAPSGTAIGMGRVIAEARGQKLEDVAVWTRYGETGPRQDGTIGFSVVRGGDIVGDHTVYFCGTGERIEISHRSSSRAGYAEGSVRAASFLGQQERGLFNMQDVLAI